MFLSTSCEPACYTSLYKSCKALKF